MPLRTNVVGCLAVLVSCLVACAADPHDAALADAAAVSGTMPRPKDSATPTAPDADTSQGADGVYVPPNPKDYTGPRVVAGVELSAAHEIVRRECVPLRFGTGFTVVPGVTCSGIACRPGIECTRPADCKRQPHARCFAPAWGHCDYGAAALSDTLCVADADCHELPGGRCTGTITQTFCEYNNDCETSADCAPGKRCDCNESGDLLCFQADCRVDADCPSAQKCLRANPCNWGPYGDYRCTTPADECVPYEEPGCGCDYDTDQKHWRCKDIICD